jgi:hypothetical protein
MALDRRAVEIFFSSLQSKSFSNLLVRYRLRGN